jgi:acetyltransferase-like isoleucine patch superfamily enzyme
MIDADVRLGANVKIFSPELVNIFGCEIGDGTFVGPFVEITRGTVVGRNCKIESHSFLCDRVTLEDDVFIGHGVMFTNDLYPRSDRQVVRLPTLVKQGATVGAGAVVAKDVPDLAIAVGNPARTVRQFKDYEEMLAYMNSRQPEAAHE